MDNVWETVVRDDVRDMWVGMHRARRGGRTVLADYYRLKLVTLLSLRREVLRRTSYCRAHDIFNCWYAHN